MFDFVSRRNWYYLLSALVILPGVISLIVPPALKPGIDFTSGTTFSVRFAQNVSADDLRSVMSDLGHPEARVQQTGENRFLVRTKELTGAAQAPPIGPAPPSERDIVEAKLHQEFGDFTDSEGNVTNRFIEFASVSATVSREIGRNAFIAVAAAAVAILLYISWAFRSVPSPFRYGVCAIVALIHDSVLVVGAFSIFGKLFGTEINTMFITGLLTVVGFSVHDTIVVFDRVRENMLRVEEPDLAERVNTSLVQTLSRSLNTSLTLMFAVVALLLLGGESIRPFLIVLLIGTITGTYSSIFIAAQLLITWENGDVPRLFRRIFGRPKPQPVEA
jgi:preprotein translocase subunit SecF